MRVFSVTKSAPELIGPSDETPAGNLPLSFMDRLPPMRFIVESIHVYRHGEEPAQLIRGALAKALVHYYPMAGRFAVSADGELEVACTGDGVWFVEAQADFPLEDVNNLELPLMIRKEDILPYVPPEDMKDVVMLMQVTEFKCGGFVVGIRSDHAMGGGAGVGALMQTVVEMARGLAEPSLKPAWGREAIPNPAKPIVLGPPPVFALMELEKLAVDVPMDYINRLKNQYMVECGQRCSTFDVVLAKVWQSRTQAMDLHPDADTRVAFAASTVHLMKDVLPEGFYGNCGYPLTVSAPAGKVAEASLMEVVRMIREAKESLWTVFSKWLEGDPEADPFRAPPDYGLLAVSDWSKVGFHELDYGWGEPMHVAPLVDDNPFMASGFFLKAPAPKQGVRVMTSCVTKDHVASFRERLTKLE
ncbi:hypothetical protein Cni_G07867 [Canna indica]|uniref:Uncharacterized protein n=1 Tax=Canna indica TaxID=4628 RepID=A0AAQ3K4S3_9LILI|nr:hypothetical protein Cni_G07867 [Canna indica]